MKTIPSSLQRLLNSAATTHGEPAPEMPFGFDTRVVALWRASVSADPLGIAHLLRRVTFIAAALIVLGSAGVYREFDLGDEAGETVGNEYAIADSAIGVVFDQ